MLLVGLPCALGHWTTCWGTVNDIILGLALKTLLPFGQLHTEAECHQALTDQIASGLDFSLEGEGLLQVRPAS